MHHPTYPILLEIGTAENPVEMGKKLLTEIQPHPQTLSFFWNQAEESLKIADVRNLQAELSLGRAASEPAYYFLCAAEKLTLPAQNALLKILEEPPANIRLVLIARSHHNLLPTILSRCVKWKNSSEPTTLTAAPENLFRFLKNPELAFYSSGIALSEELKDREAAIRALTAAVFELNTWQPIPHLILKTLLTALDSLQKNGNVRLVLEDCFFAIKSHHQTHSGDSF